jgi:bacteriocin-like protein
MKFFKKKTDKVVVSNAKFTTLNKNQLKTVVGGLAEGQPIGGIVVKGGRNPGGQM